ncbi:hypothetical protein SFHH103_01756 [Sinorhizobium fredii HH103]|uniref:Uncharacterized protein n=1 Tax=Sinorhizobium fredii (strain HH103) TaxID=1117943 RepID=G9A7M3_SINF1|nr:hypothetical protein SFHH103_01756 [Sinorhizobium fredii HH103]
MAKCAFVATPVSMLNCGGPGPQNAKIAKEAGPVRNT